MTLPYERARAVLRVREFLHRLASPYGGGIKGIRKEVRQEARALLRHYPMDCEIELASEKCPELFDVKTATQLGIPNNREEALEMMSALDQSVFGDNEVWPSDVEINGLKLVLTCPACPEQYDVFNAEGKQVGYLRLRHGYFRADYPDCGGETVYESQPKGDGIFDDNERMPELTKAVHALLERNAKDAVS